jgi:hypothetical protein
MRIFVLTATHDLRVSRKSHLRDHPTSKVEKNVYYYRNTNERNVIKVNTNYRRQCELFVHMTSNYNRNRGTEGQLKNNMHIRVE